MSVLLVLVQRVKRVAILEMVILDVVPTMELTAVPTTHIAALTGTRVTLRKVNASNPSVTSVPSHPSRKSIYAALKIALPAPVPRVKRVANSPTGSGAARTSTPRAAPTTNTAAPTGIRATLRKVNVLCP